MKAGSSLHVRALIRKEGSGPSGGWLEMDISVTLTFRVRNSGSGTIVSANLPGGSAGPLNLSHEVQVVG